MVSHLIFYLIISVKATTGHDKNQLWLYGVIEINKLYVLQVTRTK